MQVQNVWTDRRLELLFLSSANFHHVRHQARPEQCSIAYQVYVSLFRHGGNRATLGANVNVGTTVLNKHSVPREFAYCSTHHSFSFPVVDNKRVAINF